ncbi:death domain-containing membrane protein NRADD-like [Sylvia atricapilla]|uniref:death domain-containing membrane protein NRADD-like n=1 Tax=Sylvia atricapilla TaxID=48155 RepID=UPI003397D199
MMAELSPNPGTFPCHLSPFPSRIPTAEGTPPVPGEPRVTPPVPEVPGDIIPLYCALLAALVVGLLAYVAFKCWDTCRKKRQLDKAREAADAGDAEKLRGDGGGLEATQSPAAEVPALSPRRPEEPAELERLLELGTAGDVTSAV